MPPQPMGGSSYMPYLADSMPVYPPVPGFGGTFCPYPPTSTTPYPQGPSYPTPYPTYPTNFMPTPSNNSVAGGTGTIKDEHIRESLLTGIQEKLMRRMKEQFQQTQAELETLKRTQDELKQGKAKLDSILIRLEKEKVKNCNVN